MTTLESSNHNSTNFVDAGIQILEAGTAAFRRLDKAEGLQPIGEAIDELGDPQIVYEFAMQKAMVTAVADIFGDAHVRTEESGLIVVGKDPNVLVAIDNVDGTHLLRKDPEQGLFGPMVTIFTNLDPTYDDARFGGFTLINANQTYFGDHESAHVIEPRRGSKQRTRTRKVETSGVTELNRKTRINSLEELFPKFEADYTEIKQTLQAHGVNRRLTRHPASAVHYARVADARRRDHKDAGIEFHRKGDFEAAAGYPIIKGAGGDIVTKDTEGDVVSLGRLPYLRTRRGPLVIAATRQLGDAILGRR